MDWANIRKFCFTYALPDGAWLEDANGYRNWEHASSIIKHKGAEWYRANIRAHGWMTGCWIDARP